MRTQTKLLTLLSIFSLTCQGFSSEQQENEIVSQGHTINFNDVPVVEFIRFVSKISHVNFIFDNRELQFNITLVSGKPVSSESVVKALMQMLFVRGFVAAEKDGYFVIHKSDEALSLASDSLEKLVAEPKSPEEETNPIEFFVHKLKYHQGSEIQEALKQVALDHKLQTAAHSSQWIKVTNSLLCSGDQDTLTQLKNLINKLDVPLRQVFIEVLVIETDVKKSMEFGLQWAAGGNYQNKLGFGMGAIPPSHGGSAFANTMQNHNAGGGLSQIPLGNGFDIGVIGDIIMHKGKSFLTLGSLVSALQQDGDSTIVLNQKIITQDNKNSKIFVGDNIPFTGSVIQSSGQNQLTTANIEYRDIGVNLSITPMLGDNDIITLDLDEEITESVADPMVPASNTGVNGIRTTKTNMVTHVHVPDNNFLVLSGMIRNAKSHHKSGIPCLGGLPFIGAAFSKTHERDERRNVIIFVRPHIIHSFEEYNKLTGNQEAIYERQSAPADFNSGLRLLEEGK